jgi:membrane associated rhomboid family serine protease
MRKLQINGRRGALQILFTALYLVVGYSFITNPSAGTRGEALRWLTPYLPIEPFAALWLAAAAFASVAAFKCRPDDSFGFVALVLAPSIWGALFLIGGLTGSPSAYTSAAVYGAFAGVIMIASGMQGDKDRDRRKIQT